MLKITDSLQYLKGIGPKRAKLFQKSGLKTIEDLLYYFPTRYQDRAKFLLISQLREGEAQAFRAKVITAGARQSWKRRGFNILETVVSDGSGNIVCIWFNQPYLKNYLKPGVELILYGKVERYANRLQISSPEFELIEESAEDSLSIGRIVPVYRAIAGITQRHLRGLVKYALDEYLPKLNDFLEYDLRKRRNLCNLAAALLNIHFPKDAEAQKTAYHRLAFDEFFFFQLPLALRKVKKQQRPGIAHKIEGELIGDFIFSLPFKLTGAQEKVIAEIKSDMARPVPMHRLLQGDVGCGKTAVATIASLAAIQGGYQAVFMAPTEILAKQHYLKIGDQLNRLSGDPDKIIRLGLLTGSVEEKNKKKIYRDIESGKINFIIGTHALLEEGVNFKNLGLIIIDEQHKFGVGQRALLPGKGINPDVLIMTATPIPRTLAITLYGDLDISVINELPPGRAQVKTSHFTASQREEAYIIAEEHLKKGSQVFIVYPVIEESYALDIAGAKKMYAELKSGRFKKYRLGLIHGRLKKDEQDAMMSKFRRKKIGILVATSILEVGIDVPEATCMIIESAERFGLSQLHQLRGRVGRSSLESVCLLISDALTPEAARRMEAMVRYQDGFRIAEEDLKIRGPGEFFGKRQHGLSELKIANPLTQLRLLKQAKEEAIRVVERDPLLNEKPGLFLKEKLLQIFPEYEKLMMIG